MKTQIINISKPSQQLAKTNGKIKSTDGLAQYQNNMQQMWQMYQEQLQRNFDLMQIINRQQLLLQQPNIPAIHPQLQPGQIEKEIAPEPAKPEAEIEPLNFKRLNTLAHTLQSLKLVTRIDASNSIVNFLYILQCMGGTADPDLLFHAAGISAPTGYRYAALLSKCSFIMYKGNHFGIKYQLTEIGNDFLEGKLESRHEFVLRCKQ